MIKSVFALALCLSSIAAAGVIQGHAYGSATGAPFNRTPGQFAECSWGGFGNYVLSGGCSYVSGGTIARQVQGGPDWSNVQDQFVAQLASSVDASGALHASEAIQYTNEPVDVNFIHDNLQGSSAAFADTYADSYQVMSYGNIVPIQMVYNVSVDGTFFQQDLQETVGYATFNFSATSSTSNSSGSDYYTTSGTHNYQMIVKVNPGDSVSIGFGIHLSAELACTSGAGLGTHLCNANEGVDFSNTAKLTSMTVEDLQGNVLTGYTVTSQSGYDYNSILTGSAASAAAPEPGTFLLAAAALALALYRRRVARVPSETSPSHRA